MIVAWTRGGSGNQRIPGLASAKTSTTSTTSSTQTRTRARRVAHLLITANIDSSWLQVHRNSAAGPIVFQGTLEKGQQQLFTGRRLWIDIARPEVLTAMLNGKLIQLPTGGAKRIIVTARGLHVAGS